MALNEAELRADLQQYYGIDLDDAISGRHRAAHIAALVSQLPQESRLSLAYNKDGRWTLENVLLAAIVNQIASIAYGMTPTEKRGAPPEPIGPSYLVEPAKKTLPARVLPIDKLIEELNKPRRR